MTPPGAGPPVLVSDRRSEVGRRRIAPKAVDTSDVTRYRGVLAATIVGMVVALVAVVISWATGTPLRESRPLSHPHRVADLTCQSCHVDGAALTEAVNTCVGCHGPHDSQRAGHASLARAGTLVCTSCHEIHGADGGVTFRPDGSAIRYGHGTEIPVDGVVLATPIDRDLTVPVPEASRYLTAIATAPQSAGLEWTDLRSRESPLGSSYGGTSVTKAASPTSCPWATPTSSATVVPIPAS
jgi:predicted CXXCH cytochrome family protein